MVIRSSDYYSQSRPDCRQDDPVQSYWAVDLLVSSTNQADAQWLESTRQVHAFNELQALRQAAYKGEQQKQRQGGSLHAQQATIRKAEVVGHYADPLAPLRDRDHQALTHLFEVPEIEAIEFEIKQMLLRLFPEPCWDEDIFSFLSDFL